MGSVSHLPSPLWSVMGLGRSPGAPEILQVPSNKAYSILHLRVTQPFCVPIAEWEAQIGEGCAEVPSSGQ